MRMMPLEVMVPTTAGLTLALPAGGAADKGHAPFGELVTIAGIKDAVDVMSSLQRPKKARACLRHQAGRVSCTCLHAPGPAVDGSASGLPACSRGGRHQCSQAWPLSMCELVAEAVPHVIKQGFVGLLRVYVRSQITWRQSRNQPQWCLIWLDGA